jgi:hypothetical protein
VLPFGLLTTCHRSNSPAVLLQACFSPGWSGDSPYRDVYHRNFYSYYSRPYRYIRRPPSPSPRSVNFPRHRRTLATYGDPSATPGLSRSKTYPTDALPQRGTAFERRQTNPAARQATEKATSPPERRPTHKHQSLHTARYEKRRQAAQKRHEDWLNRTRSKEQAPAPAQQPAQDDRDVQGHEAQQEWTRAPDLGEDGVADPPPHGGKKRRRFFGKYKGASAG